MSDLSILIQKRGRIKGTLTRMKSFAENIQENTSLEDITARLEKIEKVWSEFLEIEDNLLLIQGQTSELEEFENKYFDTKAILIRATKPQTPNQEPIIGNLSINSNVSGNHAITNEQFNATMNNFISTQQSFFEHLNRTQTNGAVDLRLPRINIPNFSGDYKEWPAFQDLFETMVDKNGSLTGCQKLQYLKGLLKGEGAAIIRHLTVTESNYVEAWEKLKTRFNKKRHITASMIRTFVDQNAMNQLSARHLRNLYDTFDEVVRGLRALGPQAQTRDPWLIFIALGKLDSETKQLWIKESSEKDYPTFDDLLAFLNRRCDALETCNSAVKRTPSAKAMHATSVVQSVCLMCKANHTLYQCPQFKMKSINERKSFVTSNLICFNCLQAGHSVHTCRSKHRCFYCKKGHHSLLHETTRPQSQAMHSRELHDSSPGAASINISLQALVNVEDVYGQFHLCRVLLDSGSQISFISESCVQRLALKRQHARLAINGLSATNAGFTRGKVLINVSSRFNNSKAITVEAFIMTHLSSSIPSTAFSINNWSYINQCQLADPKFNQSGSIDIIIGAEKFFDVIKESQIRGPSSYSIAQQTIFGWVLYGSYSTPNGSATTFHSSAMTDLDIILKRFWEIEEVSSAETSLTQEELLCEEYFKSSFSRSEGGRYIVSLPFKNSVPKLGSSEYNAVKRLYSIENRFRMDPIYKEQYTKFMREYLKLGHMELVPESEQRADTCKHFYLPHHAVFKASPSTKIRVVFDGSHKSTNGLSLNDNLMIGPTVQRDLVSILLSFRKHRVAFSADIEKMYRQVQVTPNQRDFQRIIWREDASEPMKHFRLTTVTYGTSSAPFLATRILKQVALDNLEVFPEAAAVIQKDFYVDDVLSGTDSIEKAIKLQNELKKILELSGFNLTKWRSNYDSLTSVDCASQLEQPLTINVKDEVSKVLGIQWNPQQDVFSFNVSLLFNEQPTKRRLLSESSRIFDPLGWLSPVVISIKILFQQIWLSKVDWDDALPTNILEKWEKIKNNLTHLSQIEIPRLICHSSTNIHLHGFSDASELAYGAVDDGTISINLVAAKSKVAPLKQISLPRLELCAALLLSRLICKVSSALELKNVKTYAWTDSCIVLSWLADTPGRWKTYIANRTTEILSTIPRSSWSYVPSADNPADIVSRGISPIKLKSCNLWWQGPSWLCQDMTAWPSDPKLSDSVQVRKEERSHLIAANHVEIAEDVLLNLSSRCSSWTKIVRILGYCQRFIFNCKQAKPIREKGVLKTGNLQEASRTIIKWIQSQAFSSEIKYLLSKKPLPAKSLIISLHPFLDREGVLRVGGRLQNSSLSFNVKHPRILPKDHQLTLLIVREIHLRQLHPGASLLVSIIRQDFWIIRLKQLVKKITHYCIACYRQRATQPCQLMGNLPESRVTISRPFSRIGVDYAGPILVSTKL